MRSASALLVALAWAAAPAGAQPFLAPGTGVFTWEPVTDRPLKARALSFGPDGRFYAATDTVYVYEPAPEGPPAGQWRKLGGPRLLIDALLALDPGGDTLLVGRANVFLSRSVDGGLTWADVNGDTNGPGGTAPPTPGGFFVLPAGHAHAGRILAGGGILYSDDRGATWADAAGGVQPGFVFAHTFAVLPSGRVFMSGDWGVAASDNGGMSYTRTPLYGDYHYEIDGLAAVATPGSVQTGTPSCGLADGVLCDGAVAVGVDAVRGGIWAWWTNDGGRSWSSGVRLPQPDDGVGYGRVAGAVALPPGPDGLGRALAVLGRGLVYGTADGGQTWAAVGRMPLDVSEGAHWVKYAVLGPDRHVWVTTIRNGAAYDDAFVFRTAEPAEAAFPVAAEEPPSVPLGVGVSVRPNPADGHVEVVVSLAAAGPVRVVVVDALGREVAVLLDLDVPAGASRLAVETSGWPAGVYTVRVTGPAGSVSRRVTVVR